MKPIKYILKEAFYILKDWITLSLLQMFAVATGMVVGTRGNISNDPQCGTMMLRGIYTMSQLVFVYVIGKHIWRFFKEWMSRRAASKAPLQNTIYISE
jgi:hypothetical protein